MTLRPRRLFALSVGIVLLLTACNRTSPATTTITVWHFWSEPHQAVAMRSLADAFEAQHPDVHVSLVPLQWSDGKAKLQMALASQEPPDVVHLGLDWFGEFARYDLFEAYRTPSNVSWQSAITHADSVRALPWLMNCRAMIARHASPTGRVGLCTSDPHNVLKRMLPLLWNRSTTTLCKQSPISGTMDDACVQALDDMRMDAQRDARMGRSRDLDDMFVKGTIDTVVTGMWMLERILQMRDSCVVLPIQSIVNADVLAVPRGAQSAPAHAFIAFAAKPRQVFAFCRAVPEAGFPTNDSLASQIVDAERDVRSRAILSGFLSTLRRSTPLPNVPRMLDIEAELEDMIERCLHATSRAEVVAHVQASRRRVATLE